MIFDKIEDDIRRTTEFILRVKGVYSLADVKKMNFQTYFRMLEEAEAQEMEMVARMEQVNSD